ncbi:MAG: ClpV1 family T6SS ATPase, partial [Desulfobacteraceae bacterium 4572_88]
MITADIKSLTKRLNTHCAGALEGAAGFCISRTHYEIAVEHVLIKLLEDPRSDIPLILHHFGLDTGRLIKAINQDTESFPTGCSAPVISKRLPEWFQDAWLLASVYLGENHVRSGALLLAFLRESSRFTIARYAAILDAIRYDDLLKQFKTIVEDSTEQPAEQREAEETPAIGKENALARFCVDFTAKAKTGEIDPVFGRDREIRQMVDILARRRKNNPIVVGEAGVGKTAVVEGLALRIVEDDVPDMLRNVSVLGLDMG